MRGLDPRTEFNLSITLLGYTPRDACDVRPTLAQKNLTNKLLNVRLTEEKEDLVQNRVDAIAFLTMKNFLSAEVYEAS